MEAILTPEEVSSYSVRIDSILAGSDINTVSAKRIRLQLQQDTHHDVSHQKKAINDLIQLRFDKYTAEQERIKAASVTNGVKVEHGLPPPSPAATSESNSPAKHKSPGKRARTPEYGPPAKQETSSELSELDETPAKKKPRKSVIDDDAAYAAKLQAQLNSAARPTRGGGARPAKVVSKKASKPKKKSAAKITADDDSDVDADDGDGEEKKTSERGGAFNKPMYLSQALQDLLGVESLSRPKTVKGIWNHIKANDLQNPEDRRKIFCDAPLKNVFKKDTVDMFSMNKLLSSHLSPMEDQAEK